MRIYCLLNPVWKSCPFFEKERVLVDDGVKLHELELGQCTPSCGCVEKAGSCRRDESDDLY